MGGKNAPGLVGFPTPDTPVGTGSYLLFLFDDPTWAQWILGALENMVYEWNWYESGDLLPGEASEAFRIIIQQAPYNTQGSNIVDTPFWDDSSGDDASDESPPDEQEWFGIWDGETFVESLSYWAVTAFLATGFTEQAAIQFITPLRTFRLTLKKNPHGAKLLALMDGNLFDTIDLYSATDETTTVDIISPGSTLILVHSGEHNIDATPDENGNYLVTVIKSQLSEDVVLPPDIRYDGDPPIFQTTIDGTTWVDSPESDPRYNPGYKLPPLTTYTGIECDVAARMTAQLKATLDIFIATGDAAQFATQALAILVFPLGVVGWLLDAILFVANALIDIGQADIEAAFTSGVYDDIQCIFSCYVALDGSISRSSLDAAYDDIKAAHPGVVATTIDELRFLFTDVPMSNAGVSRNETGDCSGCDPCGWFVEFDFSAGNTDHFTLWIDDSYVYGGYTGEAFVAAPIAGIKELLFYILMPGVEITAVSFYGEQGHGTGGTNNLYYYDVTGTTVFSDFHLVASGGVTNLVPVGWYLLFGGDFVTTEGMGFYWNVSSDGLVTMQKIRIGGIGTPPTIGKRVTGLYG